MRRRLWMSTRDSRRDEEHEQVQDPRLQDCSVASPRILRLTIAAAHFQETHETHPIMSATAAASPWLVDPRKV